jgi:hypothetical protein
MKKKAKAATASHMRIPKGHPAYNLPEPQGGAFDGQMSNPGLPAPPMPQGAPMGDMPSM